MLNRKAKIAVFVSGGGTNLQALIDSQGSVIKSGEIAVVISSKAGVFALERASKANIPSVVVEKKQCAFSLLQVLFFHNSLTKGENMR